MQKRVLAFLMVMAMVLSLLPVSLVGAETETTAPVFSVTMQKAHNQTDGSLAIDIYLQTTVDSEVTGYQFTVAPAEGLAWTGVVDATGNDNIKASEVIVYDPAGEKPITVTTSRKLVATITVTGETLPAQAADAVTLTDVTVTTADGSYDVTDITGVTVNDAWAAVEGTWLPLDQATFDTLGSKMTDVNYYLVEDITTKAQVKASNVNLDLNGYTFAASGTIDMISAEENKTLTINDSTATGSALDGTLKAGTLVAGNSSYGGGVYARNGAVLTVANVNIDASAVVGTDSGYLLYSLAASGTKAAGKLVANNVYLFGGSASAEAKNPVVMADARGDMELNDVRFSGFDLTPNPEASATQENALLSCRHQSNVGNLVMNNVVADGCNNYSVYVKNTNKNKFESLLIKGDTKLTDPVYIENVGTKVTLDLGENAQVNILTKTEVTAEEFGNYVEIAEGATLPNGVLVYENLGCYVTYENGVFSFGDNHKHDANEYHDNVTFRVWNDPTSLPTEGNYYLTTDVTIDSEYTVSYGTELNLDLNGHTITQTKAGTRVYFIYGVMNLFDCAEEYDADGNWTGGVITGGNSTTGGALRIGRSQAGKLDDADRPTLNMYGGRVAGNGNTNASTSAGAVYITSSRSQKEGAEDERGGLFNMYGGELYDNHTDTLGGAVTVWGLSTTRSGTNKDGESRAIADGLGAEMNLYGGKIHGNSSASGGAIHAYNTDAVLNVYGGEISDNTASLHGGAIDVTSKAILNIEGGVFQNNTAERGGAVYVSGASPVSIKGAVFTGNAAKEEADVARNHYGSGGALYLYNITTEATIADCVFDGNSAYRKQKGTNGSDYAALGGAIYSYATKLRIEGCEIINNSTNNHGGALVARSDGGYTYVKDTTITGNSSGGVGGAMYYLGTTVTTFDSCTVTGNTTKATTGGAVYITSVSSRLVIAGDTVIAGNIKTKNPLQSDIFFQSQATRTNLMEVNEMTDGAHVNLYFDSNSSPVETNNLASGFVRLYDGNGTQTDWDCGWITVYTSSTDTGRNVSYMDTDADGVKEFVWGHYHTMADGTLQEFQAWSETTAPTEAGYYYLADDITTSAAWKPTANLNICFNGKTLTAGTGNTILLDQSASAYTLNFYDCTGVVDADGKYVGGGLTGTKANFGAGLRINRSATEGGHVINWYGGAIYNCAATAVGTGSSGGAVIYIQASNTDYPYAGTLNIYGGAVYGNRSNDDNAKATATVAGPIQIMSGAVVNIYDGLFYDNSCTDAGTGSDAAYGGVFYNSGTLNIYGGKFTNNHADDRAGVIYNNNKCYIYGGTFEGNYVSQGYGGVVYNEGTGDVLYIEGTADNRIVFKDNYVEQLATTTTDATTGETTTTYSLGYAGALECMNGVIDISYADFIGNKAGLDGGAIRIGGGSGTLAHLNVDNCTFTDNEANKGGAIYVQKGNTTITSTTFTGNSATDRGGAILGQCGSTTAMNISGSNFTENYAKNYAGAIYGANAITLTVTGTDFTGNSSDGYGGVMYTANSTVVVSYDGCNFEGNSAKNGGVMAHDWQKTATYTGCTFTNNTATNNGGVFYNRGNNASVVTIGGAGDAGCTFTGNQAYSTGAIWGGSSSSNGVQYKGTTKVINSTFTENESTYDVAAIKSCNAHQMFVTDCTIQNNTSKIYGALHLATSNATLTLAGKMVVTDNVSTNYVDYAENTDLFFQGYTDATIDGRVDVSGLTEGSSIGVLAQDDRMKNNPDLTINGGAAMFDYFYSNSDRVILTTKDGEIHAVKYIAEDGTTYGTVQAAIEAAEAAGATTFQLQASTSETLTLTTLSYLDLNGKDAAKVTVPAGMELTLVDTTTNDYDCSDGYGEVVIDGEGTVKAYAEDTTSGSLKRYVVITDAETGKSSAHRVYLAITAKTLRPTNSGVGFKAIFAGDQVVTENVAYGVQLSGYSDFSEVLTASFDTMEAGATTSTPNQKTVVIYDAITAEDTSRWDADLYGRPFITIGDQTVYGKDVTVNMMQMAANALASGDQTVIDAVIAMMDRCYVSADSI